MNLINKILCSAAAIFSLSIGKVAAQDIFAEGGTGSAQYTSVTYPPTGENYTFAFDGNAGTKYLLFNYPGSIWLQWTATTPIAAVEYSITSANDAPERDPKNWTVEGSQDGTNWVVLDTRTNESFATRGLTKTYTMSNSTAYKHYRLVITAILNTPSTSLYQMADWGLKAAGGVDVFAAGGSSSAQYQANHPYSNTNETWDKVFDGNAGTKYLLQRWLGSAWVQWTATTPVLAAQYTITSANDAPTRDPMNWRLQGSQDGTTWTDLDVKTNETFDTRGQVKTYSIPNTTAYKHYRLQIDANKGSSLLQFADWRLLKGIPPAAPSNLTLSVMSPTQILATWNDNSSNETSFDLERSTDGVNFTVIQQTPTNSTSFVNTGLRHNTSYYYRIRSKNVYGSSAYSNVVNIQTSNFGSDVRDLTDEPGVYTVQYPLGSPSAEGPDKLIDNDINTKMLLFTWTTPEYPATPDYWVQYKVNAPRILTYYTITSANDAPERDPKDWELLGSNDGTSWTVIDTRANQFFNSRFQARTFVLNNNTTAYTYYRWHITANNGASNIAGQIAEWQLFGIDPAVPVPPSELKITAVGRTSINLSWKDNSSNEAGFEVGRSEDGINFVTVASPGVNVTTYSDQGLLSDYRYYYQVRAKGQTGNSFWSNTVDTTTEIDPALPRRPINLRTTAVTNSSVSLLWDDQANNETGFEIERSTDSSTYTRLGSLAANTLTYTDNNLNIASRYFYRVRAINAAGNSFYSNVRTVITTGQNQAPTFNVIPNQTTCNIDDTLTITITGITAGPEAWQQVGFALRSSNNSLFSVLSLTPVTNGTAQLRYKSSGIGGTSTITITAKDNGGTYNGGTDSLVRNFTITINPLNVQITPSRALPVPRFDAVQLNASGATNYKWQETHGILGGQNSASLSIKPTMNTLYKVVGTTAGGCRNEAQLMVQIVGTYNPEVVNVLTPNGDGKNDKWVIWNISTFPESEVKVFDRAGRMVFSKKNYTNDWDGTLNGKPLPEGTYIYVIDLGSGMEPLKGVLTIIRDRK
jgi:gliding motility-associated-like protein